jgi:hypothetical protein
MPLMGARRDYRERPVQRGMHALKSEMSSRQTCRNQLLAELSSRGARQRPTSPAFGVEPRLVEKTTPNAPGSECLRAARL